MVARMKKYRDSLKILYAILVACSSKGLIFSEVMREANLDGSLSKVLLNKLVYVGYLKVHDTGRRIRYGKIHEYSTTPKGFEFIKAISDWVNTDFNNDEIKKKL